MHCYEIFRPERLDFALTRGLGVAALFDSPRPVSEPW